jgi:hypothetical protein
MEVGPQSTKGSIHGMQGDNFTTELGGILEVTMWLWALFGYSTQLCCVGYGQSRVDFGQSRVDFGQSRVDYGQSCVDSRQ